MDLSRTRHWLVLAGACVAGHMAQAQWPMLLDRHPGSDALAARWCAPGRAAVLCGEDLRLLDAARPGQLLLSRRLAQESGAAKVCAGNALALLWFDDWVARVVRLEDGEVLDARDATCVAQADSRAWVGTPFGLLELNLDAADLQWTIHPLTFSTAPEALCVQGNTAWCWAADSLRSWNLEAPSQPLASQPWPHRPLQLAAGGGRVVAALGEAGLALAAVDTPSQPGAVQLWQPLFPVLDAAWWRDELWVLAAGDSGLALADFSQVESPRLLGRWSAIPRAQSLDLRGDSLLVAEGATGASLHVLRETGDTSWPELLARHGTRVQGLALQEGQWESSETWVLDGGQGFRRFSWPHTIGWPPPDSYVPWEESGVGLPLPVDGGDWRAGLLAGCRFGAGLRYYEQEEDGFHLQGIHPTDPVKLLAWGPDDLIAYVTPDAFIAIKQANRSPWFLRHHGTLGLNGVPLSVAWSPDRRLWVGLDDGRLVQVNVSDPASPLVEQVHQLAGPVKDISMDWQDERTGVVAAQSLYLLVKEFASQQWRLADSLEAPSGSFTCASLNALYCFAGLDAPPRLMELAVTYDGSLNSSGGEWLDLPAAPTAVGRRVTDGSEWGLGWVTLENGDLLLVAGWDEVGVPDEPPARPGGIGLEVAPNPFNPRTTVVLTLPHALSGLELRVHDLGGRLLHCRHLGPQFAGSLRVDLEASSWPSGLLLLTVEDGDLRSTAKLLHVK